MLKVSVIVPVYNPGDDINDCIRTLLDQSLPSDEYEVIFVDDGSTDSTPQRLDQLASEHPHVHTIHIPNSGWPGRPRNVGMDAAKGEFVYFVDNDDYLGREALERMYHRAIADDADIVLGKVVGRGKAVPRVVFRSNRKGLTMRDASAPLALLSPHKLFRKSMLVDNDVRFPEGKRRLEDHNFVVHAYFHANSVSILADYPCYYWVLRGDRSNASSTRWDAAGYYDNVREVLDIVEAHTEPGPVRDQIMNHWYRGKILGRVGGTAFLNREPDWRRQIYEEVRKIALERYPPEAEDRLVFQMRVRSHLLRTATQEALEQLAAEERRVRASVEVSDVVDRRQRRLMTVTGRLEGPVLLRRQGGRILWVPPKNLRAHFDDAALDVTDELDNAKLHTVLVSKQDGSEFIVPTRDEVRLEPSGAEGDHLVPVVHGEARVAPRKAAGGKPLPPGSWKLIAKLTVLGFSAEAPVKHDDGKQVVLTVDEEGSLAASRRTAPPSPRDSASRAWRRLIRLLKRIKRRATRRLPPSARRGISGVSGALSRSRETPAATPAKSARPKRRKVAPEDRLVQAPVFILSTVRSGSTLLRVIMNSHSQVKSPHELHLRHVRASAKKGYPRAAIRELGLGPGDLTYLLWDRILHRELQRSGKQRLVNKTPNDVFIADRIVECWPDAKFLFLLRHPVAIANSRQAARKQDSEERNHQMVLRYGEALEKVRQQYPGLTVRYEDLTTDPEGVTRQICEWMGIPWEAEMLNYQHHDHGTLRPGLGDWTEKIKSGQIQPAPPPPKPEEIPDALRGLCEAWGYLPSATEADPPLRTRAS